MYRVKIRFLSLLLVFCLLLSCAAFAVDGEEVGAAFSDMPPQNHWSYPGIAFCLEHGLMKGVDDHTFDPDGVTTRAQLITILWRMSGSPNWTQRYDIGRPIIHDLTQDWYKTAVDWAFRAGVTTGTSEYIDDNGLHLGFYFEPDAPVTREQLITFLDRYTWKLLNLPVPADGDLSRFPDAGSVSDWAVDAVRWAVGHDILHGTNVNGTDYLDPQGYATRAQIATLVRNYILQINASSDAD